MGRVATFLCNILNSHIIMGWCLICHFQHLQSTWLVTREHGKDQWFLIVISARSRKCHQINIFTGSNQWSFLPYKSILAWYIPLGEKCMGICEQFGQRCLQGTIKKKGGHNGIVEALPIFKVWHKNRWSFNHIILTAILIFCIISNGFWPISIPVFKGPVIYSAK